MKVVYGKGFLKTFFRKKKICLQWKAMTSKIYCKLWILPGGHSYKLSRLPMPPDIYQF